MFKIGEKSTSFYHEIFRISDYQGSQMITVQDDFGEVVSYDLQRMKRLDSLLQTSVTTHRPFMQPRDESLDNLVGTIVRIEGVGLCVILERLRFAFDWKWLALDFKGRQVFLDADLMSPQTDKPAKIVGYIKET